MATYAVGDIQGCLDQLHELLRKVNFEPQTDCLWLLGDLVNRGPDSLATLRFVKNLPNKRVVLGNHDLHLLAVAHGVRKPNKKDTLDSILSAEDGPELLHWLRQQPLLYHDSQLGYTMVHAGIPPIWNLEQALSFASEVETVLQSDNPGRLFDHMYGNMPDVWSDETSGSDRFRIITNYLTRMRFCSPDGQLELNTKTAPDDAPNGFAPWFSHSNHLCAENKILFGHWASLQGRSGHPNFLALDTGCVWGGELTALRLEDSKCFSIPCDCGIGFE